MPETIYELRPLGFVHSPLTQLEEAPMQGGEGAPDAWLEMEAAVLDGLDGLAVGEKIIVITWLHQADRQTLKVYPRDDKTKPLTGVFATRSPDRPNPLGLHPVRVLAIDGNRVKVGPLEVIDGTPVVDIKPDLAGQGPRHDTRRIVMGRIIVTEFVTLDGVMEAPGEMSDLRLVTR